MAISVRSRGPKTRKGHTLLQVQPSAIRMNIGNQMDTTAALRLQWLRRRGVPEMQARTVAALFFGEVAA